jgi:hypothetical protein
VPETWAEALGYPFYFAVDPRKVSEIPFRDGRLATLYAMLVVAGRARAVAAPR